MARDGISFAIAKMVIELGVECPVYYCGHELLKESAGPSEILWPCVSGFQYLVDRLCRKLSSLFLVMVCSNSCFVCDVGMSLSSLLF
jgi:hypothetical protein